MDRIAKRTFRAIMACWAAVMLAGCTADASLPAAGASGMIPNGVYRSEISADDLLEAGVPATEAQGNSGLRTLTVENGTFRLNLKNSSPDCTGTLTAVEGRTRFTEDQPPMCSAPNDPTYFDVSWSVDGDQLMLSELTTGEPHLQDFEALLAVVYTSRPWTIIG